MSVGKQKRLGILIRTIPKLGLMNVLRVAWYRVQLKIGVFQMMRSSTAIPETSFFKECTVEVGRASSIQVTQELFGWFKVTFCSPPDWGESPFYYGRRVSLELDWTESFAKLSSDIDVKEIWELSRFYWVPKLALRVASGEQGVARVLNEWLGNWIQVNPPCCGLNWACGQEASLRVISLAQAAVITEDIVTANATLLSLVRIHLERIAATIQYAIGQNNNHATSEAAALFIGGSWLVRAGRKEARHWEQEGRRLLEKLLPQLIEDDGSSVQYSVNYQRVVLDTVSMVEVWRRHIDADEFSSAWRWRVVTAARWLQAMVDPITGDAPNLGANDGAYLLSFAGTGYRDFRLSVQLAFALFVGKRAYGLDGEWNRPLSWLGVPLPKEVESPPMSRLFDQGGYVFLRRSGCMVLLRYPRFRYRPSHADALHVDLWVGGVNHLRDAGTYSYNADVRWLNYFSGTESHNTIQFDGRDQMPRVSRFLFGDWLRASHVLPLQENADGIEGGAGYRDRNGAVHSRNVFLRNDALVVRDEVAGFTQKAVLRWRLGPGEWRIEGKSVTNGEQVLTVESDVPVERFVLTNGWESRFYLQKEEVAVLEVEIRKPGTLTSSYCWRS